MRKLLAGCLRESINGYVVDGLIEAYPNISELMNASLVHPRETFKGLIRRSCASCVLVHNHRRKNRFTGLFLYDILGIN